MRNECKEVNKQKYVKRVCENAKKNRRDEKKNKNISTFIFIFLFFFHSKVDLINCMLADSSRYIILFEYFFPVQTEIKEEENPPASGRRNVLL